MSKESTKRKHNFYSSEFKQSAVKLVSDSNKTITNHYKFKNHQEAKNIIFEYIEVFYNRIRIHSANNYLAPAEFEERNR